MGGRMRKDDRNDYGPVLSVALVLILLYIVARV